MSGSGHTRCLPRPPGRQRPEKLTVQLSSAPRRCSRLGNRRLALPARPRRMARRMATRCMRQARAAATSASPSMRRHRRRLPRTCARPGPTLGSVTPPCQAAWPCLTCGPGTPQHELICGRGNGAHACSVTPSRGAGQGPASAQPHQPAPCPLTRCQRRVGCACWTGVGDLSCRRSRAQRQASLHLNATHTHTIGCCGEGEARARVRARLWAPLASAYIGHIC